MKPSRTDILNILLVETQNELSSNRFENKENLTRIFHKDIEIDELKNAIDISLDKKDNNSDASLYAAVDINESLLLKTQNNLIYQRVNQDRFIELIGKKLDSAINQNKENDDEWTRTTKYSNTVESIEKIISKLLYLRRKVKSLFKKNRSLQDSIQLLEQENAKIKRRYENDISALNKLIAQDRKRFTKESHKVQKKVEGYLQCICELSRESYSLHCKMSKIRKSKFSVLLENGNKDILIDNNIDNKSYLDEVELLYSSPFFNAVWYAENNMLIDELKMDPALHYLIKGATEGFDPSEQFDGRAYLICNPDVQASGMNPLIHYIKYGKAEGREVNKFLLDKKESNN
ncbi:MAG: hypothetical protein CL584_01345 [Alteromonadaceae bacterium]|nr:hypothetical protein [Alteromonadaceae bacterium]|tara:strand:+ start:1900 stop:2937 length:1038 start_codon:yes stop_codon:yes gene_type:complete